MQKRKALHEIVKQVKSRLDREVETTFAIKLLQVTFNLTSMRAEKKELETIFQEVEPMTAYDEWRENIINARQEGRLEALRNVVLKLGNSKFGKPTPQVIQRLNAIKEVDHLDAMIDRMTSVSTWAKLLK